MENRVFSRVQRVMGRGSEGFWATGLRGSTGLRRKSTGTAGNRHWKSPENALREPGFLDFRVAGHWVAGLRGSGLRVSRVFTGDRVAGAFWSRRRHPPEDRTPPSTLPISSRSQHLSVLPPSHTLCLSSPLSHSISLSHSLSVGHSGRRTKRRKKKGRRRRKLKERRKKGKEEKKRGRGLCVRLGKKGLTGLDFCPFFSFLFNTPIFSKL